MDLEDEDEYEEEVDADVDDSIPQPTREELEYLELRKRLKERIRRQMKKEGDSAAHNESPDKRKNLPYDNYGSFFGPSQPIISKRVIEESKSLLETRHLASKSSFSDISNEALLLKKNHSLSSNGTNCKSTAMSEVKMKVQKIKDARDYSFLLSDDAELPQSQSPLNPKLVKSGQVWNGKPAPPSNTRQFHSRFEERGPVPANNAKKHSVGSSGPTPSNKPKSKPVTSSSSSFSRDQLSNRNGNGVRRPVDIKGNSRVPPAHIQKPVPSNSKNMNDPLSNSSTSLPKKPSSHQYKPSSVSNQSATAKQTLKPSQNTVKKPSKIASNARTHEYHSNRKTSNRYSDEDEDDEDGQAINMIRQMFGYNPNKFSSRDDDDSDMEANFADIQEEERRSSRIARREDEEELRKIEEEEEMMRLRKIERKRKLNQR